MWVIWKWIGLGLMIIVYFLLVYWQRRHWRSLSTELGIITITVMFFDWLMTWFGQSLFYWQRFIGWIEINLGIFNIVLPVYNVNEFNPLGRFLLGWHPMAFAVAFIFYMIMVIALIRIFCQWSRFLMVFISAVMVMVHGYYTLEWLFGLPTSTFIGRWINDMPFSYLPFIIIGLLVGILLIRKKEEKMNSKIGLLKLEFYVRGIKALEQCPICGTNGRTDYLTGDRKDHFICQACGFKIERLIINAIYLFFSKNPLVKISRRRFEKARKKFTEEFLAKIKSLLLEK